MLPWKTLTRETILRHSKWLTVENHSIGLPDGRVLHDWPWVITPAYTNVAAVTTDGKLLCFRQTKYGVDGICLAPVGGYIEPDEDPLESARRELLEETGYEASSWTPLGKYTVDGNHGAGVAHLFLARGARRVTEIDSDDLEEQELLSMSQPEVEAAIANGEFKVLPWATVYALALIHLRGDR